MTTAAGRWRHSLDCGPVPPGSTPYDRLCHLLASRAADSYFPPRHELSTRPWKGSEDPLLLRYVGSLSRWGEGIRTRWAYGFPSRRGHCWPAGRADPNSPGTPPPLLGFAYLPLPPPSISVFRIGGAPWRAARPPPPRSVIEGSAMPCAPCHSSPRGRVAGGLLDLVAW